MVTINDIAKETGFGRSTVASVLSGKAKQVRISDRAIETVQATAKKLGYQRNEIARSIAIGKTHVIGFLLPQEMSSEHCFRSLQGVMNQTAKYSYFVKIVKIDSNSTPESIAGICLGQRFDGVVCYGVTFSKMNNTDFIEKLHLLLTHKNIPMTIAGGSYPINKAIHITPNDKQGGRLAFEHLYALGHKTFFIPFEYCRESWANDRLCGFHEAAQNAGITLLDKYIPKSKMIFNYTVKKLQDIFCSSERPTAIFCLSDYTALRMLTDLSHMGFMIPEDISLVGYGNLAFAQQCKMTSIEEQLVVIGERAVDTLLKEINDSMHKSFYEETLELFDVKLVVRDSTTTCN